MPRPRLTQSMTEDQRRRFCERFKDGRWPIAGHNHTSWDSASLCVNPKLLETLARSAGAGFVQILPEADPGYPRLVITSDSNWQGVVMPAKAESLPARPARRPWLEPASTKATKATKATSDFYNGIS